MGAECWDIALDFAAFCEWLHGLHVVVIDDGRSCARQQGWLLQTGAMVTHVPQPAQAIELARARAHDLDLLLIDADAHECWHLLVEQVPPACAALIVSTETDIGMLRGVTPAAADTSECVCPESCERDHANE